MLWRAAPRFAKHGGLFVMRETPMSPDALNSFFSLCIGFAVAGALASGYQALVQRPAGFGLLQEGVAPKTFAAVPFLVFAAPFIIMRNTLRGKRIERRRFGGCADLRRRPLEVLRRFAFPLCAGELR